MSRLTLAFALVVALLAVAAVMPAGATGDLLAADSTQAGVAAARSVSARHDDRHGDDHHHHHHHNDHDADDRLPQWLIILLAVLATLVAYALVMIARYANAPAA